jgi:5'-3' exonuclease
MRRPGVGDGGGTPVGVNLRDLFPQHPVPGGWFDGKRIAVDGHNFAYRYLSAFRDRDTGDMMRSRATGRPIGHLLGFTQLVRHLRERGAEPIIVWDGEVHQRKRDTVDERNRLRRGNDLNASALEAELRNATLLGLPAFGAAHRRELAAQVELLEALLPTDPGAAADLEESRRRLEKAASLTDAQLGAARHVQLEGDLLQARRRVTRVDGQTLTDCSRLFATLGVAVAQAPHDGERYAAALCHAGHADAVATEDFDALVAGAPVVLRKAGGPDAFLHRLSDLEAHAITREQLRHIAILCGTDFHPGVKGFGAKTAAKLLRTYPDLRVLIAEAERGGASRHHELLRAAGLTLAQFDELDAFLADLPASPPPVAPRDDIGAARDLADQMGLDFARVRACFC